MNPSPLLCLAEVVLRMAHHHEIGTRAREVLRRFR